MREQKSKCPVKSKKARLKIKKKEKCIKWKCKSVFQPISVCVLQ